MIRQRCRERIFCYPSKRDDRSDSGELVLKSMGGSGVGRGVSDDGCLLGWVGGCDMRESQILCNDAPKGGEVALVSEHLAGLGVEARDDRRYVEVADMGRFMKVVEVDPGSHCRKIQG